MKFQCWMTWLITISIILLFFSVFCFVDFAHIELWFHPRFGFNDYRLSRRVGLDREFGSYRNLREKYSRWNGRYEIAFSGLSRSYRLKKGTIYCTRRAANPRRPRLLPSRLFSFFHTWRSWGHNGNESGGPGLISNAGRIREFMVFRHASLFIFLPGFPRRFSFSFCESNATKGKETTRKLSMR